MAKNLSLNDRTVRIQVWDTAGSENFRSLTRGYFKNSTCAFIVYDITNKKSFDDVYLWLRDCRDMCYKNILIYLIGNKNDLEDKRQISYEDGKKYAEENNLIFFETSALTGKNVEEAFINSATELVRKLETCELNNDLADSGIKIFNYPNQGVHDKMLNIKKKQCC